VSASALSNVGRSCFLDVGDRGTLLDRWDDEEGVALLRLIAGIPDPDDDPAGRFAWCRDPSDPVRLRITRALLGITVTAPTPEMLAEGIEYLAERVDGELPHAQAALEMCGVGGSLADCVADRLRRLLAVRPPDAPRCVAFVAEEARVVPATPAPVDVEALRDYFLHPEIIDERSIVPFALRA
jgi:hypothetical protein